MGGMKDLFGDEPYESSDGLARRRDPATSHKAAAGITPKLGTLKLQVLICCKALKQFTDLDIDHWCCAQFGKRRESSYRKRRDELRQLGFVEATNTEKHQEGSDRAVSQITDRGLRWLADHGY